MLTGFPRLNTKIWALLALKVSALVLGADRFCLAKEELRENAPDVLFVVVDDLNDWISLLGDESGIKTPNLERLASQGTLFSRAYCTSPACNPSRAATLTGLRPTTTGVYGNKSDWRSAVADRKTIPQKFMSAEYDVRGAGKIFHHHLNGAFHDDASFHDFQSMRPQVYPTQKLNGAPEYGSRNTDWGIWPSRLSDSIDFQTVEYCRQVLQEHDGVKPLFLACGIFKPHSPFFAPQEFHRPPGDDALPPLNDSDLEDLPSGAHSLLQSKKWFWTGMQRLDAKRPGTYADFIRAYAACVRFADAQIGAVLDAAEKCSSHRDLVVVLWSDHGFHLGEKEHIEKFALWEKSTHVPLIVVAPGISKPNSVCNTPVDLSVLYPTILELAEIRYEEKCDGSSIVPLLRNPDANWEQPAVMTYGKGNHAIRSERWRYIRYSDGTEELYDHRADPHEWNNLANIPGYAGVKAKHAKWLPQAEVPQVPDLRISK